MSRGSDPVRPSAETKAEIDPAGSTGRLPRAPSVPDPLAATRLAEGDDAAFDTDRLAPSLPTALFERYKIKRKLGAGGMGVVYEALDQNLHRVVALKVLKLVDEDPTQLAEAANRLVREARAMAVLSHRNVVTVYDVGIHGMQVYVAMQLVDGTTLRHWLGKEPRTVSEILRVLCDAGAGLAAAHSARLIHRDFKPDNVLVSRRGSVRVTDFGLARRANFDAEASLGDRTSRPKVVDHAIDNMTKSGAILGTPAYMPPEQSEGRTCDARADQFSFCVTAWEALYGTRPFSGNTWSELYSNVVANNIQDPDPKQRVPKTIQKALRRGLSVDPVDRFESIRDLLAVLDTGIKKPRPWVRYLFVPAISAALAGVITFAVNRMTQEPPPRQEAAAIATIPAPAPSKPEVTPIEAVPIEVPARPAPVEAPEPAPVANAEEPRHGKRKKTSSTSVASEPEHRPEPKPPVEAPPPVDPVAGLRTKRKAVDAERKDRGLLPGDVPAAATAALEEAEPARAAGDAVKAELCIADAQRAINGVVIDYAFINAKLARINKQLAQSTGREEEFRALYVQLKKLVQDKKFNDANALLNDMAARLKR